MNFKILLTTGLLASCFSSQAQNANRGYAITGNGTNDFNWMNIRQIDLATGKVTGNVFDYQKTKYSVNGTEATNQYAQLPTAGFVAAAAYDRRSEKLFFVPMRVGQLRWLDTDTKGDVAKFSSVEIPNYIPSSNTSEENNITRMVIAADGNGYAITNDGNHLYHFTTGKKPVITDLGSLVDADDNKGISVHNRCSSWGGDMIADAYGKLYIISATRNVFVVDPATRITSYKGSITGLPGAYTTNGAAVDESGNVIICSAIMFEGYYKLNIKDLTAVKIEGSDAVYNASDLASGNLLFQKEADAARAVTVKTLPLLPTVTGDSHIYPNPITSGTFRILLDGKQDGAYTVVISDLAGRGFQSTKVSLTKGQQAQEITLKSRPAKGTYLVKVLDEKNNVIISDKVMIL